MVVPARFLAVDLVIMMTGCSRAVPSATPSNDTVGLFECRTAIASPVLLLTDPRDPDEQQGYHPFGERRRSFCDPYIWQRICCTIAK